jgi:hypothetical protein
MAKLACIVWYDSVSAGGWCSEENYSQSERCVSVGWVVGQDDYNIAIACSKDEDGEDFLGTVTIPKASIVSAKEVEELMLGPEKVPEGCKDYKREW